MTATLSILALLCAAALVAACGGEPATVEPEPTLAQATPTPTLAPTASGAVPAVPLTPASTPTPTSGADGGQAPTATPSSPSGGSDPTPTPAPTAAPDGGAADPAPTPPPTNTPTPTAAPAPPAGWRTDGAVGGQVGDVALNQTLTLAGGASASLEQIAAGRPLVLYFFEST